MSEQSTPQPAKQAAKKIDPIAPPPASSKPNPVGRPPIYKTAEELAKKIDEYFTGDAMMKRVWTGKKFELMSIPTISGLVLFLGFDSRQSFYDLENRPGFSYTVKRARIAIEAVYEEKLHGNNAAGPIFALKNFGWRDKQELEHTGDAVSKVTIEVKERADAASEHPSDKRPGQEPEKQEADQGQSGRDTQQ